MTGWWQFHYVFFENRFSRHSGSVYCKEAGFWKPGSSKTKKNSVMRSNMCHQNSAISQRLCELHTVSTLVWYTKFWYHICDRAWYQVFLMMDVQNFEPKKSYENDQIIFLQ